MRIALRIAVAHCLAVLAACGHAQPTSAPVTQGTPPAELRVPELDEYRKPNASLLADRIYIFGRSDQLIAYAYEPADEACGCYTLAVIVQDLATGAEVWTDRYESGELDPAKPDQLRNLEQVWRARGPAWEQHIRKLGIVREPVESLEKIATTGTTVPRLAIHVEDVGDDSPEGYAHLTTYRIDVVSARRTTPIAKARAARELDLLEVRVPGYVAPRGAGLAAVLILERKRGWEGMPHLARLRFVGADLR